MARRRHRPRRRHQNPSKSRRQSLQFLSAFLLSDAQDDEEELAAVLFAHHARRVIQEDSFPNGRWGVRGPYFRLGRSEDFLDCILYHFSERQARIWLRMNRETFWTIHALLEDNPVFHQGTANRPQRPVCYQLATFLCRAGAESALKVACVMSIAEGTVYLYSKRVCKALRSLRDQFLAWPGPLRRDYLSREFQKGGFPGCLGSGDGSLIRLREKPVVNGFSYWCRKKFYSLVIQATVDHRGIFTSYDFGWPGSVQDSRVFRNSDLWINREDYFRSHEYILVDKGYPLTKFTIRPFGDEDLTTDPNEAARRSRWNKALSALRIFVEHAFGRLKGRFPILRCLPGRNLRFMYLLLIALMILHNILETMRDDPETIEGFNGAEDSFVRAGSSMDDEVNERDTQLDGDDFYRTGLFRRKRLMDFFETNILGTLNEL